MKETERVTPKNNEEFRILENALNILVRMIVRTIMSEISGQREIISNRGIERETQSPRINAGQQEESLLLNIREGARLLKVSKSRVYELVNSHQIPSIRFGKRILIPRAQLARFIEEAAKDSLNPD